MRFFDWLKHGRFCLRCRMRTGYRFYSDCDTCQSVERVIEAYREFMRKK